MSTLYLCDVTVEKFNKKHSKKIQATIKANNLGDLAVDDESINACGNVWLYAGRSGADYTSDLSAQIWKANGGKYCEVIVRMACMDDLPYDEYCYEESEYRDIYDARHN